MAFMNFIVFHCFSHSDHISTSRNTIEAVGKVLHDGATEANIFNSELIRTGTSRHDTGD
jgi:hypothetical protein